MERCPSCDLRPTKIMVGLGTSNSIESHLCPLPSEHRPETSRDHLPTYVAACLLTSYLSGPSRRDASCYD